jgi:hypothetical protein
MSRDCAWRCRTGRPSCGFSNAKQASLVQVGRGMLSVRRRVELLEQALPPVVEGPPEFIHVDFVDADRKVVDTLELKMSSLPAAPHNRRWSRWRLPPAQGGW